MGCSVAACWWHKHTADRPGGFRCRVFVVRLQTVCVQPWPGQRTTVRWPTLSRAHITSCHLQPAKPDELWASPTCATKGLKVEFGHSLKNARPAAWFWTNNGMKTNTVQAHQSAGRSSGTAHKRCVSAVTHKRRQFWSINSGNQPGASKLDPPRKPSCLHTEAQPTLLRSWLPGGSTSSHTHSLSLSVQATPVIPPRVATARHNRLA